MANSNFLASDRDVIDLLQQQGIDYEIFQHSPVPTVQAARELAVTIPGVGIKNLALISREIITRTGGTPGRDADKQPLMNNRVNHRVNHRKDHKRDHGNDRKSNLAPPSNRTGRQAYRFLVVMRQEQRLLPRSLGDLLGVGRLSFIGAAALPELFGVTAGALNPYCAINAKSSGVELIVDLELQQADRVASHPMRNDKTLVIAGADLWVLLQRQGVKIHWCSLPLAAAQA